MDRRIAERMIAALDARLTLAEQHEAAARRDAINLLCCYAGFARCVTPARRVTRPPPIWRALAAVEEMVMEPGDEDEAT
jgi:hypothetical protein